MVMRVQLQAQGLWEAVEYAGGDRDDRAGLAALLHAVPPEMIRALAGKDSAKEAWETLRTMRMGSERVREVKAQTRRREFEEIRFRDGESIEDFSLRLTAIVNELELLSDPVSEYRAVLKFLRAVPRKFRQMAMAIESFVDLQMLSIEELCGHLQSVEEVYALDDVDRGVGELLLTEREWNARQQHHGHGSSSGNRDGKGHSGLRPHGGERGGGRGDGGKKAPGVKPKGKCRYYNIPCHWARECRKAERDRQNQGESANLVEADVEPQRSYWQPLRRASGRTRSRH